MTQKEFEATIDFIKCVERSLRDTKPLPFEECIKLEEYKFPETNAYEVTLKELRREGKLKI